MNGLKIDFNMVGMVLYWWVTFRACRLLFLAIWLFMAFKAFWAIVYFFYGVVLTIIWSVGQWIDEVCWNGGILLRFMYRNRVSWGEPRWADKGLIFLHFKFKCPICGILSIYLWWAEWADRPNAESRESKHHFLFFCIFNVSTFMILKKKVGWIQLYPPIAPMSHKSLIWWQCYLSDFF
jgi:hypothetical protein